MKWRCSVNQNMVFIGKNSRYKLFLSSSIEGDGSVGIPQAEDFVTNVSFLIPISDRVLLLKLAIGKVIYTLGLAATKQLYEWQILSICLSYYEWPNWGSCKQPGSEVKGQCHSGQHPTKQFLDRNSRPNSHMMHKAWCCIWEVPYCFSRSLILTQIEHLWTVTPVRIHQWLPNNAESLK